MFTRRTFKESVAPGYFNFSENAKPETKKLIDWFDRITLELQTSARRYDEFFRLWMTKDYSSITPYPEMYLYYLADNYGFGFLRNDLNFIRDLLTYLTAPVDDETFSKAVNQLFNAMLNFGWITPPWFISAGAGTASRFAETLVVFSTSGSPPSTPSNTPYTPRTWSAPVGWTKTFASATYYSYGYLVGGDIVWLSPRLTSLLVNYYDAEDLSDFPLTPSTGDICLVADDGTGDVGAGYYYDGGAWRKFTTPNANQGLVGTDDPTTSSAVLAPATYVSSVTPPPISGPSQGFGFYSLLSVISAVNSLEIFLTLTTLGGQYIDVIIILLKRIKPIPTNLLLTYLLEGVTESVEIKDLNSVV